MNTVDVSRALRRGVVLLLMACMLLAGAACKRVSRELHEAMYVSAPQTSLRDRVAAVYNKTGTLKNGERVEVLEKVKRFAHVRTMSGQEGWVELRSLVTADTFKAFEKMAKESQSVPVQGHGLTRAELNMHVSPGRETETLYQLADAEKVEIIRRGVTERATPEQIAAARAAAIAKASGEPQKPTKAAPKQTPNKATEKQLPPSPLKGPMAPPPSASTKPGPAGNSTASGNNAAGAQQLPPEEKPKQYDDWWLVRNKDGHVGWVLARMIDLDVPLEVAQYAEGQRIQAAFVLNTVQDEDKQVAQYLVVLNEPKDGLPYDFNQIRVFSWNLKRHRYETAYRERNIMGYLPVTTGNEKFPEGMQPVFTIRVKLDNGTEAQRKYRLIGPIVRRVLAPGEQPSKTMQAVPKNDKDQAAKKKTAANAKAKPAARHKR